jgi:hypothetical protein
MNNPPGDPRFSPPTSDGYVPPPSKRDGALPFPKLWPLMVGACTGLAIRGVAFDGDPGEPYAAMMASFIYLSPIVVGAITVYVAERYERRSWGYYFGAAFLANVLYVLGALLILIEGLICAILIIPLFALLGGVAGLLMGAVCRLTNWPRQTLYSVAVLPLILGFFEADMPLPTHIRTVERTTMIDAPVQIVWREINFSPHIAAEDVERAWIYQIGVPIPQSAITLQQPEGPVRTIRMSKNVYFEQHFLEWDAPRKARWKYKFSEDSFPAGALDEHVVIGGHYFDLQQGSFTLTPRSGQTELSLSIRYRLSTQFNWYAGPIARALMGNLEETILGYYKTQSEKKGDGGDVSDGG